MALFRWRGSTSNAFNNGTNWVDAADAPYLAGRYPGSVALTYDDVIFDAALSGGANSVAGYDASAGEGFTSFRVSDSYTGDIGSAGSSIIFVATDTVIDAAYNRNVYISGAGAAGVGLGRLVVTGGNVTLGGRMGNMTMLYRGVVVISAGSTVTNTWVIGYENSIGDLTLTVDAAATLTGVTAMITGGNTTFRATPAIIRMTNGTVDIDRQAGPIPIIYLHGGRIIWSRGSIGGLIQTSGTFEAAATSASRTNVSVMQLYGGTFDLSRGAGSAYLDATNGLQMSGGKASFIPGQRMRQ